VHHSYCILYMYGYIEMIANGENIFVDLVLMFILFYFILIPLFHFMFDLSCIIILAPTFIGVHTSYKLTQKHFNWHIVLNTKI
jgi:hypothetical protein